MNDANPPAAGKTSKNIPRSWTSREGSPASLGVTWVAAERAFNFAIYSKHAETVVLLIYNDRDFVHPILRFEFDYLRNKSGPIWHCRIPASEIVDAVYYAYQMDGPPAAEGFEWHCFDFEKILLDPYAKAVYFPEGFARDAARRPGSNAGRAPLGILRSETCVSEVAKQPLIRHESDLVIYEMHVKGFTFGPESGVATAKRGTFLGIIEKIPYLQELGVTAIELMPVFQFDPKEENYWGYSPLSFFAPHHGYASDPHGCQQYREFRSMVDALHQAGIEVLLDVVYNHSTENDLTGPTYSLKGIDSSSYYMMTGDPASPFANYSGTGNTLHTSNRATHRLIVESLRYWDTEMGVDGFRFDLASIFTRDSDGEINLDEPIIDDIGTDPQLNDNRLIAEPWDAGGAFQLGRKFPGRRWMQWNASFRDTIRRFVRGEAGLISQVMTRVYGSDDLFPDDRMNASQPWLSVNYVTSHDGFTLYDLVTYSRKRNWANGHNNQDGWDDLSSNSGWEGDENVPAEVMQLRKQQAKNFVVLLMLSNGTPMFRMGDEFLQTQQGNNNPYNQDNETSWLNWQRLAEYQDIFRFFKRMIAFRKSHPSISRSRFWREDVHWYGAAHAVDMSQDSQCLAYCLHGASEQDNDLYVMMNMGNRNVEFGVHEGLPGDWRRVVDTSRPTPDDMAEDDQSIPISETTYHVQPRSIVVLLR